MIERVLDVARRLRPRFERAAAAFAASWAESGVGQPASPARAEAERFDPSSDEPPAEWLRYVVERSSAPDGSQLFPTLAAAKARFGASSPQEPEKAPPPPVSTGTRHAGPVSPRSSLPRRAAHALSERTRGLRSVLAQKLSAPRPAVAASPPVARRSPAVAPAETVAPQRLTSRAGVEPPPARSAKLRAGAIRMPPAARIVRSAAPAQASAATPQPPRALKSVTPPAAPARAPAAADSKPVARHVPLPRRAPTEPARPDRERPTPRLRPVETPQPPLRAPSALGLAARRASGHPPAGVSPIPSRSPPASLATAPPAASSSVREAARLARRELPPALRIAEAGTAPARAQPPTSSARWPGSSAPPAPPDVRSRFPELLPASPGSAPAAASASADAGAHGRWPALPLSPAAAAWESELTVERASDSLREQNEP